MSVYFIGSPRLPFVKIGRAIDPEARRKSLQTGNPYPLEILVTVSMGPMDERCLHKRFANSRGAGEWFARSAELDDLISDLRSVPDDAKSRRVTWLVHGRKVEDGPGVVKCATCYLRWNVGTTSAEAA